MKKRRMRGIPVENLRRNISVFLGLVPGFADDTAIAGAEESDFVVIIGSHGRHGCGDSGGGGSGL